MIVEGLDRHARLAAYHPDCAEDVIPREVRRTHLYDILLGAEHQDISHIQELLGSLVHRPDIRQRALHVHRAERAIPYFDHGAEQARRCIHGFGPAQALRNSRGRRQRPGSARPDPLPVIGEFSIAQA
jgi:hypothetical protein